MIGGTWEKKRVEKEVGNEEKEEKKESRYHR